MSLNGERLREVRWAEMVSDDKLDFLQCSSNSVLCWKLAVLLYLRDENEKGNRAYTCF